ncbi:MAG: 3-deoxy-D-manno-octulosonic acid transferase [Rhodospirillaceae bacterium]|nr:3-deoxy-D-manno-octulosonic acid transferase [Rhodospirillaceae bacterium]
MTVGIADRPNGGRPDPSDGPVAGRGRGVPLTLYRWAAGLLTPVVPLLLDRRARRNKEDPARRHERLGAPTLARPPGRLVWMHGASVGESHVLGVLADAVLAGAGDDVTVLLTTQTLTSARRLQPLTGPRLLHQFAPVDTPQAVAGFLDHWRPDVALWVESELWPNLLGEVRRRGIPALLANGRMSARSHRRWRRFPGTARRLLSTFRAVFPADHQAAGRFSALGLGDGVRDTGNLKLSAATLIVDEAAAAELRGAIAGRPVWLAASTHHEDEAPVLEAHVLVRASLPDALLIMVPRHPDRGPEILAQVVPEGAARRSEGALPRATDGVYIADTMGELGTLFSVSPVVFVAGTFGGHGGHNPIEPARFGAAILHGPDMTNFVDAAEALGSAGGARQVADAADLAATVVELLGDRSACAALGARARAALGRNTAVRDAVVAQILDLLERSPCP